MALSSLKQLEPKWLQSEGLIDQANPDSVSEDHSKKSSTDLIRETRGYVAMYLQLDQFDPSSDDMALLVSDLEAQPTQADEDDSSPDLDFAPEGTSIQDINASAAKRQQEELKQRKQQYKELLRSKIQSLLGNKQVRQAFESELTRESKNYNAVQADLAAHSQAEEDHRAAQAQLYQRYMQDKHKNRRLSEAAGAAISRLSQASKKAEEKAEGIRKSARGVKKGYLIAQELLQYRAQLDESGFALPRSRRKLLERVSRLALSGHKVFLVGSTGTGKTELAFYVADAVSGGYEVIPWHEGTVPKDIMGQLKIKPGAKGGVESVFEKGAFVKAATTGKTLIHDEYTLGATRSQMGQKLYMNLKTGDNFKVQGANGNEFQVAPLFTEIFTGNPKDEKTTEREELDPALERMLTGVKVDYMEADELVKVLLANHIDDHGVLAFSRHEVKIIQAIAEAAEIMQQCHDGVYEGADELKQAFGVVETRMLHNFLDPSTMLKLFRGWDLAKREGQSFAAYSSEVLTNFIQDPKTQTYPEERTMAFKILEMTLTKAGLFEKSKTDQKTFQLAVSEPKKPKKPYLLPSELAFLEGDESEELIDGDDFADGDMEEGAEGTEGSEGILEDILKMMRGATDSSSTPNLTPEQLTLRTQFSAHYDTQMKAYLDKGTISDLKDPVVEMSNGKRYQAPDKEAILQAMSPEFLDKVAQINSPRLIIAPLQSLSKYKEQIDKDDLVTNDDGTFFWKAGADTWDGTGSNSQEEKIAYEPVAISPDMSVHQGKTKEQVITRYGGWMVRVVEGGVEGDADPSILSLPSWEARNTAWHKKYQETGDRGLIHEEYLALVLSQLEEGEKIDENTYTALCGTTLTKTRFVASADWIDGRPNLSGDRPDDTDECLRSRRSVGVDVVGLEL